MKFLLFAFIDRGGHGGWNDFHSNHEVWETACEQARKLAQNYMDGTHYNGERICNSFQILNLTTGEVMEGIAEEGPREQAFIHWKETHQKRREDR